MPVYYFLIYLFVRKYVVALREGQTEHIPWMIFRFFVYNRLKCSDNSQSNQCQLSLETLWKRDIYLPSFACPVMRNRVIHCREFISSDVGRGFKMGIDAAIGITYLVVTIVSFVVASMMLKKGSS